VSQNESSSGCVFWCVLCVLAWHSTPLLRELHLLRVTERIQFRLCVLVCVVCSGMAQHPTATGASLVTCHGTNPVPVVCSGVCCVFWHGTAPAYLSDSLRPTSEIVARRCFRSADTTTLQVPSTRRATLGDRAFPVAAARAWNSLLLETRACSSLLTFWRETESHLFRQ